MDKTLSQFEIQAKLFSEGTPLRDTMSKFIGPIINKYQDSDSRDRVYTPDTVAHCMAYQSLNGGSSLQSAVSYNNSMRLSAGESSASLNTGAYSEARSKLNVNILKETSEAIVNDTETSIDTSSKWKNFSVKVIDGTTITASDTKENQKEYPQHASQKEGVGFPIMRLVILQSLISSMILGVAFGAFKGKKTGEMALARQLFSLLSEGDLLLGDRYYPSFFLMAWLIKNKIHGVFQSHGARILDFRKGEKMGYLDHIVEWEKPKRPEWMSKEEYEQYPNKIQLREVDITDHIGCKDAFVIVTTLLDPKEYSKQELSSLYQQRWKVEVSLREIKSVMGMDHIDAKTPKMVEKVIHSYILSFNLVRWHMINAAIIGKKELSEISFNTCLRVLLENTINIISAKSYKNRMRVLSHIYYQILTVKVGNRPGRKEPRATKRRPKSANWLNKSRAEYKAQRKAA